MLILASASPRRREILTNLGYSFECVVADTDEIISSDMGGYDAVYELAFRKAKAVSALYPDDVVIASDTVVALDNEILGKPTSRDAAVKMLKRLSGREHTVYTGVSIVSKDGCERFVAATKVEFYELDDQLIEWYISTNEPFDKAGAYGIQGKGSVLVKRIDGDYFTVMGLPSAEIYRALKKFQILPE